jgi:hypothetical protein
MKKELSLANGEVLTTIIPKSFKKKTWEYSLTTATIWASFDYGTVEAMTYDEAKEIAIAEIKKKLNDVNTVLSENNSTFSSVISMDFTQIELKEVK